MFLLVLQDVLGNRHGCVWFFLQSLAKDQIEPFITCYFMKSTAEYPVMWMGMNAERG